MEVFPGIPTAPSLTILPAECRPRHEVIARRKGYWLEPSSYLRIQARKTMAKKPRAMPMANFG